MGEERRGWQGERGRGGCSSLSPPPHPPYVKKKKPSPAPFPFPWIVLRETPTRDICSNNGARPRVPDLRPIPAPVVPPPLSLPLFLRYPCLLGYHVEPWCMCPPRFPAIVDPAEARS
ncbi:Hypothetical predicted protein [Xyrichtys novacula]|uniref:Uncharacterized protein n=1 Tax=Xyrichtys novacula TaxID=13765 RepID=A0AAV1F7W5_XYRNO|nr:Hypothetical predicted protein [Xyrichtys novacula]